MKTVILTFMEVAVWAGTVCHMKTVIMTFAEVWAGTVCHMKTVILTFVEVWPGTLCTNINTL